MLNGLAKAEHELIRRLGTAVSDRWGAIPPYAQDEIMDRACEVEIWPAGMDVREALDVFLERNTPDKSPLE